MSASAKASILIVDDDPNLRKTLCDILEAKGYAPVAAATGQAALDRVEDVAGEPYDAVILSLPGPLSAQVNRYYTAEFFYTEVFGNKREILQDGIIIIKFHTKDRQNMNKQKLLLSHHMNRNQLLKSRL